MKQGRAIGVSPGHETEPAFGEPRAERGLTARFRPGAPHGLGSQLCGRKARVLLIVPLAALLLTGCLHDNSEAEEFIDEGNALCQRYFRQIESLGPPPSPTTPAYREYDRRRSQYGRELFRQVRALDPPSELHEERDAVFAAIAAQTRTAEAIARAARMNRPLGNLLERQLREQNAVEGALRRLGWRACVQPD